MSGKADSSEVSVKQDTSSTTQDYESYYQKQVQIKRKTTIEIPDKLKDNEYPFLWCLQDKSGRTSEQNVEVCRTKLEELEEEGDTSSYTWIVTHLTLVLELTILEKPEEAWASVEKIDKAIMEDSDSNSFYHNHKDAIQHILRATKCHIMMLNGADATEMNKKHCIPPIPSMNSQNQAAIFAMKSYFYVLSDYENESFKEDLARKALGLDCHNEEWMFLLATILRFKRKLKYPVKAPEPEELSLLEKVVEKSRNCKYILFLAECYQGIQRFQFQTKQPGYKSVCPEMVKKSSNMFMEALQMKPDHAETLRRVGLGLIYLPGEYQDLKLGLECLTRSSRIREDGRTLHNLGYFYEKRCKDYERALQYYERERSKATHHINSYFDVARMKYILDPEFDPCSFLEQNMKSLVKDNDLINMLVQMAGFSLLDKNDLIKSIGYFRQIVAFDKDTVSMTEFYSRLNGPKWGHRNLYRDLMTKSQVFLNQEVNKSINTEKILANKEVVKNFLTSINDKVDSKWKHEPNYSKYLQKHVNQRGSSSCNSSENRRNSSSSKNFEKRWRKPSSNKYLL